MNEEERAKGRGEGYCTVVAMHLNGVSVEKKTELHELYLSIDSLITLCLSDTCTCIYVTVLDRNRILLSRILSTSPSLMYCRAKLPLGEVLILSS